MTTPRQRASTHAALLYGLRSAQQSLMLTPMQSTWPRPWTDVPWVSLLLDAYQAGILNTVDILLSLAARALSPSLRH